MKNEILYFGYGANRDADMMEAIVGRRLEGFPAKLEDYELCIQTWREISEDVKRILSEELDSEFKTYCIRPAKGCVVSGQVWYLTESERELVSKWEFWYYPIKVQAKDYNGQTFDVETEIINDPDIKQIVDGEKYSTFLNRKERMLEIATKDREKYLRHNVR